MLCPCNVREVIASQEKPVNLNDGDEGENETWVVHYAFGML